MMSAALRALGLEWRYVRLPIRAEALAETVAALPGSGYRGVNVTLPHKVAALRLADRASAAATAIGAANTLSFVDGEIAAENTDAGGLLDALGESPRAQRALVLGAGGAGRAAVWALREAGADVAVWNRSAERASELARELQVRQVTRPEPVDLMVNATSVGLGPSEGPTGALAALGLERLDPPPTVVDLVYGDRPTALVDWARDAGSRVVEGLDVLVAQGARSLQLWTGRRAPLEVMRKAVRDS